MKATPTRAYPYPECAPPLVEDPADLPAQLHDLAEVVTADIVPFSIAVDAAKSPPAADIRAAASQTLTKGQQFTLTDVHAEVGVDTDAKPSAITILSAGLYLIVGDAIAADADPTWLRLDININKLLGRAQSVKPTAAGGLGRMNVTYPIVLAPGDVVTMTQSSPTGNVTWTSARLSIVQLLAM